MLKTRPATAQEIIAQHDYSIRTGAAVRYRGFVRERAMKTARNGVRHIEYFRAKIIVADGEPAIIVKGQIEKLTATMVEIPSDARGDTRKECMCDLRIKSEYLK